MGLLNLNLCRGYLRREAYLSPDKTVKFLFISVPKTDTLYFYPVKI